MRIRRSAGLINEELDLLDDTRVHPESYAMASKFCLTALQGTRHASIDDEDQIAVEKATSKPELLESVDISVSMDFYVSCMQFHNFLHQVTLLTNCTAG